MKDQYWKLSPYFTPIRNGKLLIMIYILSCLVRFQEKCQFDVIVFQFNSVAESILQIYISQKSHRWQLNNTALFIMILPGLEISE